VRGCKQGKGIFSFANGTRYDGDFATDVFNGDGSLTKPDKMVFKGKWKDGTLTSPGTINFCNGNVYTGGVDNLLQQGEGILVDHQVTLKGVWDKGVLNGEVVFKYTNGNIKRAKYINGSFDSWIENASQFSDPKEDKIFIPEPETSKKNNKKACCTIF